MPKKESERCRDRIYCSFVTKHTTAVLDYLVTPAAYRLFVHDLAYSNQKSERRRVQAKV